MAGIAGDPDQRVLKNTHSGSTGCVRCANARRGSPEEAGGSSGYRNDAKIRLSYGREPGVPKIRRER
jgi:hypothetical protein